MSRPQWSHGRAVVDGELRVLSPSQITSADAEGSPREGCARKWWFEKVDGRKPPEKVWQKDGTDMHDSVLRTCLTGEMVLHPRALPIAEMLVPPGTPGWEYECEVVWSVAGVKLVMYPDCTNVSGQVYDLGRHEWVPAPRDVEVVDYKFLKDVEAWGKSGDEVGEQVPMLLYGGWLAGREVAAGRSIEAVRLAHVQVQKRGPVDVRKASARLSLPVVGQRLRRVEGLVDEMVGWAAATDQHDVPYNEDACGAYGGCPHRSYCDLPVKSALDRLFPGMAGILAERSGDDLAPAGAEETTKMGLMDVLMKAGSVTAPASNLPPTSTTSSPPATAPGEMVDAKKAGIDDVPAGAGYMGLLPPPGGAAPFSGVNPPDAAPSGGPLAADSVPPETAATLPEELRKAALEGGWNADKVEKRGRGRPRKDKGTTVSVAETAVQVAAKVAEAVDGTSDGAVVRQPDPPPAPRVDHGLHLLVDVSVEKLSGLLGPVERAEPHVQAVADSLARGARTFDVRCAPADSELGYGRWKGWLRDALKKVQGTDDRLTGWYVISTRSEVMAEAAEALAEIASTVVRGARS